VADEAPADELPDPVLAAVDAEPADVPITSLTLALSRLGEASNDAAGSDHDDERDDERDDEHDDEHEPERLPRLGGPHVPGDVVPPRAEPFLPSRQPEHPEVIPAAAAARLSSVAASGGVQGSAAMATDPQTSSLIERDPSVNRSLLLRLIAGVRGL
jgi:hypothetical protein